MRFILSLFFVLHTITWGSNLHASAAMAGQHVEDSPTSFETLRQKAYNLAVEMQDTSAQLHKLLQGYDTFVEFLYTNLTTEERTQKVKELSQASEIPLEVQGRIRAQACMLAHFTRLSSNLLNACTENTPTPHSIFSCVLDIEMQLHSYYTEDLRILSKWGMDFGLEEEKAFMNRANTLRGDALHFFSNTEQTLQR